MDDRSIMLADYPLPDGRINRVSLSYPTPPFFRTRAYRLHVQPTEVQKDGRGTILARYKEGETT